jgi:hypothetical protein
LEVYFELVQWSGDGKGAVHLSPSMVSNVEIDYEATQVIAQIEAARRKANDISSRTKLQS